MSALFTLLVLAGLALLLLGEYRDDPRLKRVGKAAASTAFVALAWSAGALDTPYGRAILVGLVLCWIGDLCLLSREKAAFLAGLGSFLAGHLLFCVAFWRLEPAIGAAGASALLLAIPAWLVGKRWLGPHLSEEMRVPVWAYIGVITAMVALAIGAVVAGAHPIVLAGAIAFYLSDLSVARDRFVKAEFVNGAWGLPMYYAGVSALAWSVAFL